MRPRLHRAAALLPLLTASFLVLPLLAPPLTTPNREAAAASPSLFPTTSTRVVFVGDIAGGSSGTASFTTASSTASLAQSVNPQFVLTGGDNAYDSGTPREFATKYHPTWGPLKARTRPSPGNHEYKTLGASGYYGYFFGGAVRPYYAFDLGNRWRGYSLNCEIDCSATSAQLRWLEADLRAHPGVHVLAYLHRPRFSSGSHGSSTRVTPIWNTLQRFGADLLLTGHDHSYERFAPQSSGGQATPSGIRQFVVGTGGVGMRHFTTTIAPNSQRRLRSDFGVLILTLRRGDYSWEFRSSGRCASSTNQHFSCPERRGLVLDAGSERTNLDVRGCARRALSLWGPLRRVCR